MDNTFLKNGNEARNGRFRKGGQRKPKSRRPGSRNKANLATMELLDGQGLSGSVSINAIRPWQERAKTWPSFAAGFFWVLYWPPPLARVVAKC